MRNYWLRKDGSKNWCVYSTPPWKFEIDTHAQLEKCFTSKRRARAFSTKRNMNAISLSGRKRK